MKDILNIIDNLPESISALSNKNRIIWSLSMWIFTFISTVIMLDFNNYYDWMILLICGFLTFTGALPLIQNDQNILHNIFGILACVLSQIWCSLVANVNITILLFITYLILLPIFYKKWCFVIELLCLINMVIQVYIPWIIIMFFI